MKWFAEFCTTIWQLFQFDPLCALLSFVGIALGVLFMWRLHKFVMRENFPQK